MTNHRRRWEMVKMATIARFSGHPLDRSAPGRSWASILTHSFAWIGAALNMRVEDLRPRGAGGQADQQPALSWRLRSSMRLAQLQFRQGRREEAREVLAET